MKNMHPNATETIHENPIIRSTMDLAFSFLFEK